MVAYPCQVANGTTADGSMGSRTSAPKSKNPFKRAAKGLAFAGAVLLAPFSCTGRQGTKQVRLCWRLLSMSRCC